VNRNRTSECHWDDRPRWTERLWFPDVGDYCDWPTCPVEFSPDKWTPCKVRFQSRYNLDGEGNVVVALVPISINGTGVDLTLPIPVKNGAWFVTLKDGRSVRVIIP